eukprot:m.122288 g.122288  ORF g.122288 m.122288 type:complete len:576 (+) comp13727_c1_seq2:261-1988(+)
MSRRGKRKSGSGQKERQSATDWLTQLKPVRSKSLVDSGPAIVKDLAVHPKKVAEVRRWVEAAIDPEKAKHQPRALLMVGPPGCGKTTTLQLICKELQCQIVEWVNPVSYSSIDLERGYETFDSQTSQFEAFLIRGSRYRTLNFLAGSAAPTQSQQRHCARQILLVEDFPNYLTRRDADVMFHELLRSIQHSSGFPVVFMVTDDALMKSSLFVHRLFPSSQQNALYSKIKFNPIAPTLLSKALSKASKHHGTRQVKSALDASAGDIRAALNSLSFTAPHSAHLQMSARDGSLSVFHALGKVLSAKRHKEGATDGLTPEGIVAASHISSDRFSSFLFENFPRRFGSFDDMLEISDSFSVVDGLLSGAWGMSGEGRSIMEHYGGSVVTRSLMGRNTTPIAGFAAMYKPQDLEVEKQTRGLRHEVNLGLRIKSGLGHQTLREVITSTVPLWKYCPGTPLSSDQQRLVTQLCTFNHRQLIGAKCLGKDDVGDDDDEDGDGEDERDGVMSQQTEESRSIQRRTARGDQDDAGQKRLSQGSTQKTSQHQSRWPLQSQPQQQKPNSAHAKGADFDDIEDVDSE